MKRIYPSDDDQVVYSRDGQVKKAKSMNVNMVMDQHVGSSVYQMLPTDIKLYILEFIQFSLSRYLEVSESEVFTEAKRVIPIKFINKEIGWNTAKYIARRKIIKLMFGYFGNSVTNLEERRVYLLFKHVNYEAIGVWGQDEYCSTLRFRDLRSIEFSLDCAFSCKCEFWKYMPKLESIKGLNLEHEGLFKSFIEHKNNIKLTSIVLGNVEEESERYKEGFFSKFPNLTRVQGPVAYCHDIPLLDNLKHLKLTSGTVTNTFFQSILGKLSKLETLEMSNVSALDYSFQTLTKPINLKRFHATDRMIGMDFFQSISIGAKFLPNLTDISVGDFMLAPSPLEFSNFCLAFSQMEHLSLPGLILLPDLLRLTKPFKNLKTLQHVTLIDCTELHNIPSLKSLIISEISSVVNYSGLDQIEELSTNSSLLPLQNLKHPTFLPKLLNLHLHKASFTYPSMEFITRELPILTTNRPNLKIHLTISHSIPNATFEDILSCPLIESLDVFCNTHLCANLENNTTLKKLTLRVNTLFFIPKQLIRNKTIEEIRIYGMDPNLVMTSLQDICELVKTSNASYISFINSELTFLHGYDPNVVLW